MTEDADALAAVLPAAAVVGNSAPGLAALAPAAALPVWRAVPRGHVAGA